MAYEVTAIKKRPQVFEDLTGQEFVVSTLKNALNGDRIAHAYLFSGPHGVGKTSAARILAKAVNCASGPSGTPCGECSACREVSSGRNLDVIEIDGASNTSVNDVREIRDEVLFAPNNCRYKVYIVDEVHMLSHSAFNALLKTIEEPPPYVIFIFATTELHKVPATIKSRCQQFIFQRIGIEVIKNNLSRVAAENAVEYEDEALFWIAKEANGSLRDAYTLFDQVCAFSGNRLALDKIQQKLGLTGQDGLNSLAEAMAGGDFKAALDQFDHIMSRGQAVEQVVVDLAEYYRCLLLIKRGVTRESLLGSVAGCYSGKVIDALPIHHIELTLALIIRLYRDIRYSLNPRFELELLISRLCGLKQYLSPIEILEQIKAIKKSLTNNPDQGPLSASGAVNERIKNHSASEESAAPVRSHSEEISQTASYQGLVARFKKNKLALASALSSVSHYELRGNRLILNFSNSYTAKVVQEEESLVRQNLSEIIGQSADLEIRTAEEGKEKNLGSGAEINQEVDMVKKVFRGEVVKKD